MLVLLSPAKTLDFSDNLPSGLQGSSPYFSEEALELVHILQKLSPQEIAKLMSISPRLSELNYQRFQDFPKVHTKPALYAYNGDVYDGFALEKYDKPELEFANQHLRIISGLYGILKPLDLIAPYRLEMSINLPNKNGRNLYEFWREKITNKLNEDDANFVINLASNEYSSAIGSLNKPKIDVAFKENQKGEYKIIGIHAKRARGEMANFIILNKITNPKDLKEFAVNNYQFMPKLSEEGEYVFVR